MSNNIAWCDDYEIAQAEIKRLLRENEALGAAMSSDGAAACGQLAVAESEIERLRAEVEPLRIALGLLTTIKPTMEIDITDPVGMAQQIAAHVADEIERLRGLLLEAREFLPDEVISIEHRRDTDYADHLADRIDAALSPERMLEERDAEIERLREFVKFLNSFRPDAELAKRDAEIERLRLEVLFRDTEVRAKADEIDRLRGLLREIGDIGWLQAPHPLTKRVREALGE